MQDVQPLAAYIPGDRVRPQTLRTATIDYGGQAPNPRRKALLWLIARLVKGDNQRIPSWKALTSSLVAMNSLCKMLLDIFLQ